MDSSPTQADPRKIITSHKSTLRTFLHFLWISFWELEKHSTTEFFLKILVFTSKATWHPVDPWLPASAPSAWSYLQCPPLAGPALPSPRPVLTKAGKKFRAPGHRQMQCGNRCCSGSPNLLVPSSVLPAKSCHTAGFPSNALRPWHLLCCQFLS